MKHDNKKRLETIVRRVYGCHRGEAMCVAESDFLGSIPFAAALVTLVPLYKDNGNIEEVSQFIDYYSCINEDEWKSEEIVEKYITRLNELVEKYCI